jgi:predicted metal-dependent hydrolase
MMYLLHQDRLLTSRSTWRKFREHLFSRHHMARRSLGHIANYLRPNFHPWQLDDSDLAKRVVERDEESPQPRLREIAVPAAASTSERDDARSAEVEQS